MQKFECATPHNRPSSEELATYTENSQQAAARIVEEYAQTIFPDDIEQREALISRAHRVRDYVHVFAGNVLPPEALDIAMLHDIEASFPQQDTARAVMDYYTAPDTRPEKEQYAAALLNDMRYIDTYANWYHGINQEESDTEAMWSTTLPPADIEEVYRLGQEVNIESILLKSCTRLDDLMTAVNNFKLMAAANNFQQSDYTPCVDDATVINTVIEAETFYGPLCEAIGFDGLAMELRSQARQMRKLRQGDEEYVFNAYSYCHEVKAHGPQAVLRGLVNEEDDFAISSVVNTPEYLQSLAIPYESVQLGEFALDVDDRLIAGNWRLKSVGSLADKLSRSSNERIPMDIMGFTAISETQENLADDFAALVSRVHASKTLIGQPAPSKEKWAIVQGDEAYVENICSKFAPEFVRDNIQTVVRDKGYRVAKFTCSALVAENSCIPTEMQFLTKEDRRNGRVGLDAHFIYKATTDGVFYSAEERRKAADLLSKLYDRKRHMVRYAHTGELTVNPMSLMRSQRDLQNAYALS